ncbi:hypothetical protein SOASR030_35320 [Leminorella grimontii]|uniref:Barstar (barnase inhibitor) domain-containing protein n=1 Tax=Leminorella grimontii TaxID=82981 RepID=A0AAV5N5L9_9GAMM|nr:hypothetical protein [Leminorella grimontii]KFC94414.1 hypothetical protein GLGR_2761 [Leminorella grimontii ATCC 33999 = DSM 5078]GKX57420.1 hypothetical protein SOASR030_35320 [Leminorella grimontii]VFS54627.1 Uncharacterised protein [Leminorella grimontii]
MASHPFFSSTSDSAMTIRGYELRSTERAYGYSLRTIFDELERVDFLASAETRIFTCFRFLDAKSDWGTVWRKIKGEDCIGLDLVFLNDVDLPFYNTTLAALSSGLQRLAIGLTTRDVFIEVLDSCAHRFKEWGHDPAQIHARLESWFHNEGYSQIWKLFDLFGQDTNLSDCERLIPWLTFDDVVFLYERWHASQGKNFVSTLDSRCHYKQIGLIPKNKKKSA